MGEFGIQHKNPTIVIEPDAIEQIIGQTSIYSGVCWNKRGSKWQAKLIDYYGGLFDNEEHAAMRVNLLCDEFGIQRRNPMIDIELDKIQQQFKNQQSEYIGVSWNKEG